jgi:NAD-dependent deacetylase
MRVFVVTGAGISAESGIPTFRGKEGYWRNLDPAKLATPEAFAQDPGLVWQWYRERRERIRAARPNAAHDAVARLSNIARDFLLVTQNVDDLHARAGLTKEKMVQIHGDIFETRCVRCDHAFRESGSGGSPEPPAVRLADTKSGRLGSIAPTSRDLSDNVPSCPHCGALMRPGVVWFGEMLDPRKIDIVENFLCAGSCDLVLVIGTTALFGYISDWAVQARGHGGELIEINPEETPLSRFATESIRAPAAVALPKLVERLFEGRSA